MTNKGKFYINSNKQIFGLFSLKRLLQFYSNVTPEMQVNEGGCGQKIGADRVKSGQKMSLKATKCVQMRPENRATKGD